MNARPRRSVSGARFGFLALLFLAAVNPGAAQDVSAPAVLTTFSGHADTVYSVAISPDGKTAATGSFDRAVKLWNLADGREIQTFAGSQGHTGQVLAVAFAPRGDLLASAGADNQVRLWDVPLAWSVPLAGVAGATFLALDIQKASKLTRVLNHPQMVDALAFDPTGKFLATGGHDGNLRVWDLAKGQAAKPIAAHVRTQPTQVPHPIYAVAWTPDGKQLLSASFDRSLKLWDAAAGTLVREFKGVPDAPAGEKPATPATPLPGHRDQVFTAAFSKDGKLLVTGSSDRTVKLWEVATGKVVREFPSPDLKPTFPGEATPSHPGWVQAVAFVPGDKSVVSVGPAPRNQSHVAVWSVADGKRLAVAEGDLGPLHSVAVTADGSKLLLGCGPRDRREAAAEAVLIKRPGK